MPAEDDDIARLMREIDAMNAQTGAPSGAQPPVPIPPSKEVAKTGNPRVKWMLLAAGGAAVAGFLIGTILSFLPFVSSVSTAVGAALGAAIAAYISGAPDWLK